MARRIQDKILDSKDARRKLQPRAKPYWRSIERGLHLGYRRLRDVAGPWIARRYLGNQRYDEQAIGIADDLSAADGLRVLDYWQAVDAVRGSARAAAPRPYTVAEAVRDYLDYMRRERKTVRLVECRMVAHVLPVLGEIRVADLTAKQLRDWLADVAATPPRVRSRRGSEPAYREISEDDPESIRKRKASANQCLVALKAALNRAFEDELVPSDEAWRKVKTYRGVDVARARYVTVAEAKRLLKACDPDFRNLVRAALETGARYGELTRMKVEDYNPDVGTVAIHVSKTDEPRHVVLTADGDAFFRDMCSGRSGLIFLRADGGKWGPSHQDRRIKVACKRAHIDPPISFHGMRHTWASLCVMAGMPLMVVAKNLGHADTKMVEKHYGHLAPSYVAETIRAKAPRFGNVATNMK